MIALVAWFVVQPSPPQERLLTNRTAQARKLGLARAAFFRAVLAGRGPRGEFVNPGYRSMLMEDHTLMFWPVGRADEVVFDYSGGDPATVTYWRAVKGVPRRIFQIRNADGKFDLPYNENLPNYLRAVRAKVSKRDAGALKSLLQKRRGYATYIESAGAGVYYCRVTRADGSGWPNRDGGLAGAPVQDNEKVDRDGLLITSEELRLMALPNKPGKGTGP